MMTRSGELGCKGTCHGLFDDIILTLMSGNHERQVRIANNLNEIQSRYFLIKATSLTITPFIIAVNHNNLKIRA
jgi:hypothetical protein